MSKEYNVGKLLKELQAAGLAVDGVDSNGIVSWANYRPGDNGEVGEVPIDLKLKAEEVLKQHDPKESLPFPQAFLLQVIKLDKQDSQGRLTKLKVLLSDPLVGAFLLPTLTSAGAFDEELVLALKDYVTADENLGPKFWDQISEIYIKAKDGG